MTQSLGLAILIACLCSPTIALAATLAPGDAAQHVGENATVCGVVASAHYGRVPPDGVGAVGK
jgi:hypothetical protein